MSFPGVTYDVTIKVEHLLRHARSLPVLRDTGCAFVTTAVESIGRLSCALWTRDTPARFRTAVELCREPEFRSRRRSCLYALDDARGLPRSASRLDRLDLVEHVAPIQLAIRLLIPQGSRMLELEDVRAVIAPFDSQSLTYPWRHTDRVWTHSRRS